MGRLRLSWQARLVTPARQPRLRILASRGFVASPKGYYAANTEHCKKMHKKWRDANKEHVKQQALEYRIKLKIQTLSYYGPKGTLQCCWPGCQITDPDMLSLDHINNNGSEERKIYNSGVTFYGRLRKMGYPQGYQTLCHNHQWKKQIMLLRVKG